MSSDKPEKTEPTDDEVNSSGAEPDEPLDPTLDVTSKQFDPLKALYSKTKHIPVKNAKIYDNISKLQSFLARKASSTETVVLLASSTSKPSTSKAATDADNPFKRRFLPHQSKLLCFLRLRCFHFVYEQNRTDIIPLIVFF